MNLLRKRLVECGWKDEMKSLIGQIQLCISSHNHKANSRCPPNFLGHFSYLRHMPKEYIRHGQIQLHISSHNHRANNRCPPDFLVRFSYLSYRQHSQKFRLKHKLHKCTCPVTSSSFVS